MKKNLRRILPILLGIVILISIVWYLFVYDRGFTRDTLIEFARYFEERGDHGLSAWLYDQAYIQSGGDETVAIELANYFKEQGNFTQAEVTLSKAIADGGGVALYIELCKTYVEQDKLLDAVTMLDNIVLDSIREELALLRPAAPSADPAPNYYNSYITVTIQGDGGTLYLSTDGEYPSIENGAAEGRLTLSGGENTIYALTVGENGLVSPLRIFGYTVSGVIEKVEFVDAKLDAAVRSALGIDEKTQIFSSDLWQLQELVLPEGADSYLELYRIPYLQSLTIEASTAESLEGLSALTGLRELTVRNTLLGNTDLLVVASLPNLERLTLSGCGLSSLENLSNLHNLQYLDLSDNSIRDFSPMSFMTGLTYLDMGHNAMTSLNAISGLYALEYLDVSYNSLSSVKPIAGCTQLKHVNISNNFLQSVSGVEALLQLEYLDASVNAISDVSELAGLSALTQLNVSGNSISDISALSALHSLQLFDFSRNSVTALPQWGADCALLTIDGSYNGLTSLDVLGSCHTLNYVLMDYNNIASVDCLANCYNLIKVSVYGNPVKDVSALTENSIIVNWNPLG